MKVLQKLKQKKLWQKDCIQNFDTVDYKYFLYSLWLSIAFFSGYIIWVIIILKSVQEFLRKYSYMLDRSSKMNVMTLR